MSVITVIPYSRTSLWLKNYVGVPDATLTQLGEIAPGHPNRRFRSEATIELCQVRWRDRDEHRRRARECLERVAADSERYLVAAAE